MASVNNIETVKSVKNAIWLQQCMGRGRVLKRHCKGVIFQLLVNLSKYFSQEYNLACRIMRIVAESTS